MNKFQALEKQVSELLELLDIFTGMNSNIEIQVVFQNILMQMVQIVGAEAVTIQVVDHKNRQIEATAVHGPSASSIQNLKLNQDEGIVGLVIRTGHVHRGPATVVNSNDRLDYFGRTVHIAARIQAKSKDGNIVIHKDLFDSDNIRLLLEQNNVHIQPFTETLIRNRK